MKTLIGLLAACPVVLASLAVGMMGMSPPEYATARGLLVGAVAAAIGWYALWLFATDEALAIRVVVGCVIGVVGLGGMPIGLHWIGQREAAGVLPPDVSLRLVYPESPALLLVNTSPIVARDIKYWAAIWNLDKPDRNDPLPIPAATFDYIRAHETGGPEGF